MQPIAEGDNLLKLIPQRPPMVMVDKLFSSDEEKCITGLHITEKNIFCRDGFFREPGLIENMAQTAAAQSGYNSSLKAAAGNYKAPVGFIGAIKDLKIYSLPPVNAELLTEVKILHHVFDATVIHAFITYGNERIAECEMKIFIKKD